MKNLKSLNHRGTAALVCVAAMAVAVGSSGVSPATKPSAPRPGSSVLELEAPERATVVIDGRDYGTQRRFTFNQLSPGVKYRCRVRVRLNDRQEEHTIGLEGGRVYHLSALKGKAGAVGDSPMPSDASNAAEQEPNETTQVARGVTALGVELYRRLAEKSGNLVISPLGLESALAMTSAGARGATLEQMARVLRTGAKPDWHAAFGALVDDLEQSSGKVDAAKGPANELMIANSLWVQQGYKLVEAFVSLAQGSYRADVEEVDFAGAGEASRQAINDWVAKRTRDRIREILDEPQPRDTRLVLANAVYFRGTWSAPFDKQATAPAPFHTASGADVEVPMMRLQSRLRHARGEKLQVLELPYAGQRLAMLVILPDESSDLASVERALVPENLTQWIRQLTPADVQLSLPRFQVDWNGTPAATLAEMGMPDAFGQAADFSGISRQEELHISNLVHRAWISVDEQGAEAAAATGVTMSPKLAISGQSVVFRVDRPFLFAIYDTATRLPLFLGRLASPARG